MGIEWKVLMTGIRGGKVEIVEGYSDLDDLLRDAREGAWESFEGFGKPTREINWAEDAETKAVLVTFAVGPDGVLRETYPDGRVHETPMPEFYRKAFPGGPLPVRADALIAFLNGVGF